MRILSATHIFIASKTKCVVYHICRLSGPIFNWMAFGKAMENHGMASYTSARIRIVIVAAHINGNFEHFFNWFALCGVAAHKKMKQKC